MEISGTIVDVLAEENGQGRNGTWRKKSFILETKEQYPKKVCITVWGDKIDEMIPQKGEEATAHINVESREYNGRWYTDVKAWKVDRGEGAASPEQPLPPSMEINQDFSDDDLPF